jgi:hypothetical protein
MKSHKLSKIPNGLGKIIENLRGLDINDVDLESLSADDLQHFPNLIAFYLMFNFNLMFHTTSQPRQQFIFI